MYRLKNDSLRRSKGHNLARLSSSSSMNSAQKSLNSLSNSPKMKRRCGGTCRNAHPCALYLVVNAEIFREVNSKFCGVRLCFHIDKANSVANSRTRNVFQL